MDQTFLWVGGLAGFIGVALGAFGAHGLRTRLSAEMLTVFETGVRYQMYHALGRSAPDVGSEDRQHTMAFIRCGRDATSMLA